MPLTDVVHNLATNVQELQKQVTQIAIALSEIQSQGKMPCQPVDNPKPNVSAITLRNGREIEQPVLSKPASKKNVVEEDKILEEEVQKRDKLPPLVTPASYPNRFDKSKKEKEEKDIFEVFRKVEVNIPLIDIVKQVPRYAKFLKDLCINKTKRVGYEKITMGANVSAVLQRKMPQKSKDGGMFDVPCQIGNTSIKWAMCDLGASINVMPKSVYSSLNAGPLEETGVVIQLANRSIVYSEGLLEDVLVQVNRLIFPADFFVLDMEDDNCSSESSEILLGRPFLQTSNTKIDVKKGTLTMEFDGKIVQFNVYDAMRFPNEVSSVCGIDILEPITQRAFELFSKDELQVIVEESIGVEGEINFEMGEDIRDVMHELAALKQDDKISKVNTLTAFNKKPLPFVLQVPKLELKLMPSHLKYAFLGSENTLPIIISNKLESD
ncbi:uncharacterized protein [Euphorbia lathyris]|uniref:uncharacterized protein isoform X2 n=1 Tax=Euphorbia lathyris TaxID=212925 RepID=UPI003314077A